MKPASDFLRSIARYLSTARLYAPDHPSHREAVEEVHATARALVSQESPVTYSFLSGRVVFQDTPLRELEDWPWADRLADLGVQRLELRRGVGRDEAESFLKEVARRVSAGVDVGSETPEGREWRHIRFGTLGADAEGESGEASFSLDQEAEAVDWIHDLAEEEGRIPVAETMAVVRSLAVAMRGARQIIVPFVRLKEADQYTAAHCINVSILAMSLAETLDFSTAEVRAVGAAGLLHDVGKVDVPREVLTKAGALTDAEWAEMRKHPEHGCRILLESGDAMSMPAMVAYEHHVRLNEEGYPKLHYGRKTLPESRLVAVCDFYDALRTRRRYRKPMMAAEVLKILRRNEGETLDPQFVQPFVSLIERWDPSTVLTEIRPEDEPEQEFEPA